MRPGTLGRGPLTREGLTFPAYRGMVEVRSPFPLPLGAALQGVSTERRKPLSFTAGRLFCRACPPRCLDTGHGAGTSYPAERNKTSVILLRSFCLRLSEGQKQDLSPLWDFRKKQGAYSQVNKHPVVLCFLMQDNLECKRCCPITVKRIRFQ